jgi:DHA1 family tetracycline resistance protein-like MFS transporter
MNLVILCLIIFLDSLGWFITLPLILRFINTTDIVIYSHHLSIANKNILFGCFLAISSLFGILLGPIVSHLSDIHGRKKILFFSLLLSVITNILTIAGFAWKSIFILFSAKAFNGIAATSQSIAEASVIDNTEGKKRTYRLGLIAFSMVMAMTLGPLLGAYLSDTNISPYFNLYTPLSINILISIINIVLLLIYFDASIYPSFHKKFGLYEIIKANLHDSRLLNYFSILFLMQFSWALFYQSISLTLIKVFMNSINESSVFLSVISLCMAFGLLVINYYVVQKFSRFIIISFSLITAAICYFSLYSIHSLNIWFGISIVLSMMIGLYYPSLVSLISQHNLSHTQGWLMGCNTSIISVAWVIAGVTVGFLTNISPSIHLLIEGICVVVAFFTFKFYRE